MQEYAVRRILLAVPTILLVMFMTFMMIRLVPGGVVEAILSQDPYATEADEAELRERLGLDEPIPIQFGRYVFDVVRGDLGFSPWTQRPVSNEIKTRLPVTLEFATMAIFFSTIFALPIGVLSAVRQDTLADYVARSGAILALSVPYFFTATLVVVYAGTLTPWSPPLIYSDWGDGVFNHLYYYVTPAILLGVYLAGPVMRLTRNQMLEVLRQDYIRTAWSKGLRERSVISRHVMRNALIPVITLIGLQMSLALSGTLILETIFNMPGLGRWTIQAIFERDYPSIQGAVLVLAVGIVLLNIVVDLAYAFIDPRIRYR